MNKKRLVSMLLVSAMTSALFTGCGSDGNQTSGDGTTSAGTNSTTEEAGIKEFTAFFGVAGSEINDDNERPLPRALYLPPPHRGAESPSPYHCGAP